ncbi:acyltransferase family protein [Colwellia sp. BRX8-9]|uniref:acyltransferase family protein n=1 Tax=Colwellia sp. BRX8-9 TaxID=2759831 RepID=UPI0015F51228|nr:acyltransferase family protein [Colwellia sp. BRX8-9]MBA6349452.1 acyltransferase [Colwellia sp. BRX8-9]
MSLKYRPDIDGLRAIAVLLVIFYHAGFKVISGGFVGVDVFFVISGFLITSIINKDIQKNEFKLFNFYVKRIKRILPSFYVVIFTTLLIGFFLLLPNDFIALGKSFLASSMFFANMFFWKVTGGYFNSSTGEMPLLHIWSLSLEEQFYFIWPFFLLFILKSRANKSIIPLTLVAVICLFIFSEWAAIHKPNAAYYFLLTRAGELLIGALLALTLASGFRLKPSLAKYLSIFGGVLILVPAFSLSKTSVFPGLNSLWPCLGAALIILSGSASTTLVSKVLSSKLLVFIGLISYPMYLWHWPIIAYINYLNYDLDYVLGGGVILLTTVLAILTWHFVEKRLRRVQLSDVSAFIHIFAIPSLIVFSLSILIIVNDGFDKRLIGNIKYLKVKQILEMPTVSKGWCYQTDSVMNHKESLACSLGIEDGDINAIFIGDSHAGHYQYLVNHIGNKKGLKIATFITSNCFPSLYTTSSENLGGNPALCKAFRTEVKRIVDNNKVQFVFLAARWDANTEWLHETKEALDTFSKRAHKIIIFPQIPSYINNVPQEYLRSTAINWFNKKFVNKLDNSYVLANKKVKNIAGRYENVFYLDLQVFTGNNQELPLFTDEGLPYYFDSHHLNMTGSKMLTKKFMDSPIGNMLIKVAIKN